MPVLSNARHEHFAQELAKGKSATEAYVLAGYKESAQNASHLYTKIQHRVHEITTICAKRTGITIESLIDEAEQARIKAMSEKGGSAAAVAALTAKAKLSGNWIERAVTENTNTNYAIGDVPATPEEWAEENQTQH